jgi:hypothetical protein
MESGGFGADLAEKEEIDHAEDRHDEAERVHPREVAPSESRSRRAMAALGILCGKRVTADGTGFQRHGHQSQKRGE